MKTFRLFGLFFLAWLTEARALDDFLDRLGETLTINAFEGQFRTQLRGTLDFEIYHLDGPGPSLIYTDDSVLLNPRVTLFVDSQIGPAVYVFAQARIDRGFDPSESGVELRADEYAVRITPWQDGRFNVELGKFATVVGNWVGRHHSWENPFVTAPLPYDYLMGLWDSVAPRGGATLLDWAHVNAYPANENIDKKMRIPLIWGPSYASGIALSGRLGKFDYAVEMKNGSLSSRPDYWDVTQTNFEYPTFSGRLGFRPNEMWNFGFSASSGTYLNEVAEPFLAPGHSLDDYREVLVGEDIAFAWHHLQVWAESYQARFEIPRIGNVETLAYYVEAKYKFTPQLFAALRWNQQLFSTVHDGRGNPATWSRDVWELESAIGYRLTAHLQLKLQYSLQHQDSAPREYGHTVATQLTLRF